MIGRKIRVLISRTEQDENWKGSIDISRKLRDAGIEVVYGGYQNVEQIVEAALQDDVEVIFLVDLKGNHLHVAKKIADKLEKESAKNRFLLLLSGGSAESDAKHLKELGINEIFGTKFDLNEVVKYIKEKVDLKDPFARL